MRTSRIILCCFGDERCKMVDYVPRINWSAMIAVFMYTLEASNCTSPVYRDTWLHCKPHPPNKGCVMRDKIMHLTDEYALTVRCA